MEVIKENWNLYINEAIIVTQRDVITLLGIILYGLMSILLILIIFKIFKIIIRNNSCLYENSSTFIWWLLIIVLIILMFMVDILMIGPCGYDVKSRYLLDNCFNM